jgi:hypothetical protein
MAYPLGTNDQNSEVSHKTEAVLEGGDGFAAYHKGDLIKYKNLGEI